MDRIGAGTRFADRFVVLAELGGGGMGVVYRARDEASGAEVALKLLRETSRGDEAARRLRREARATNELDARRVARVHEVGELPDGALFLVMEYVPGDTLRSILRKGRVSRDESLRIVREVASALGEAHRAGLVHRDVKPDNIMVCPDGRVVLLDFGIVKTVESPEDTAHLSTQLTSDGTLLGTPAYLAPEQALGRDIGPATDQFALAVTAYEILTGKLPWTSTEVTRVLAQVLAETPPPASTLNRELTLAFDSVLGRALSKSSASRFESIERFADALEAANRGELPASPASETVSAPLGAAVAGPAPVTATTGISPSLQREPRRMRVAMATLLLVSALGALGLTLLLRSRGGADAALASGAAKPSPLFVTPDSRLACPILEVQGVPDVGVRLGAAAATLACARARWYLGGRDDRVQSPALLLGMLPQPVEHLGDPYADPNQRERTVASAQTDGAKGYIDGRVALTSEGWSVDLVLRTPDAKQVALGSGRHSSDVAAAIKAAVADLWVEPALPTAPIDPEVARWTHLTTVEAGLASADLQEVTDVTPSCNEIHDHRAALGPAFYRLEGGCKAHGVGLPGDAGTPVFDDSSLEKLVTSVNDALLMRLPISNPPAIAARLDEARLAEKGRFGRAELGLAAGMLWASRNDREHANASLSAAVREAPQLDEAWQELVLVTAELGPSRDALVSASAWFPNEAMFLDKATSTHSEQLADRLRESRLAMLLEPTPNHALFLGRALAEAGRLDEVRAFVAAPVAGAPLDPRLVSFILAFADFHDAKLQRGFDRLVSADWAGLYELISVARVLGRERATSDDWASRFLALPEDQVAGPVSVTAAPIVLCLNASRGVAQRCLDRVDRLGHQGRNWWGEAGETLMSGARKYVRGDLRGAVGAWRPLVGSPIFDIVRIMPTEPFEKGGEPELAARLDERKLMIMFTAGVSEAAPRVAKRAATAGDKARARELAQKVVTAWEVADVAVPAVAEMRALLKQLDH